jgi:hypothetical protein
MFEGMKKKISHFVVKQKYIKKDHNPLPYTNAITNAHSFLVIMPKEDNDFTSSFEVLKYLASQKKYVTVFLPDHKYSLIPDKEKFKFITFEPAQVGKLNLPGKKIVECLDGKEFDVAIDLNRQEDVLFSAITNIAKSRMKVSFAKEFSESYYNLQITDKQGNSEASYRSFLNYLQMF